MATLFDGRVIILGGGTTGASPDQGQRNVLIYDPIDESFTPGPKMGNAYYAHACALFKSAFHNNREVVLVAGGASDDRTQLWDYQTEGSGWISSKWKFFFHQIKTNTGMYHFLKCIHRLFIICHKSCVSLKASPQNADFFPILLCSKKLKPKKPPGKIEIFFFKKSGFFSRIFLD